jgi:hypothetical protein
LGRNEGLSGAALVARTKEVARDTKQGLGLEVNKYAPAVANVGKQNTNKTIEHKHLLDEAEKLQSEGKTEEAGKILEQYNQRRDQHLQEMEQTPQKNPNVIPDQKNLYQGIEENHRAIHNNPAFKPVSSDAEKRAAAGPSTEGKVAAPKSDEQRDNASVSLDRKGKGIFADATDNKTPDAGSGPNSKPSETKLSENGTKKSEEGNAKVASAEPKDSAAAKSKKDVSSPKAG